MSKTQKLLIILSLIVMGSTYWILDAYLERYDYFFSWMRSEHGSVLPGPTASAIKWRHWLVWLPFVFPFSAFLFIKQYKIFGIIFFLATLISSLALLVYVMWVISIPFSFMC